MKNKVTLPELIAKVATATSTTKRMSELFLRELFATITHALENGENVSIKDVGQFKISDSGDSHDIIFKPSKRLAEVLNQPFDAFVPIELDDDVDDEMLSMLSGDATIEASSSESIDMPGEPEPAKLMPPPFTTQSTGVTDEGNCDDADAAEGPVAEPALQEQEQEHLPSAVVASPENAGTGSEAPTARVVQPATGGTTIDSSLATDDRSHNSDEASANASKMQFYKGIATGAIGMLLIGLVAWFIMRPSQIADEVAPATDTTSTINTDSVAAEPEPVKLVTDTTSATMYLSRIAKKHYGRAEFWVYIYEENKSLIKDPNNIPPGTIVVIPPAEKYGIDANNTESVEAAKRNSFELFSKSAK